MRTGDFISKAATPIARAVGMKCVDPSTGQLRPDSNCNKMRRDFNEAECPTDYVNAVLDRMRHRGKYADNNKEE